jgi:hypothetical protein
MLDRHLHKLHAQLVLAGALCSGWSLLCRRGSQQIRHILASSLGQLYTLAQLRVQQRRATSFVDAAKLSSRVHHH